MGGGRGKENERMNNIETLPSVYEDSKTKCTEDC
jgi:hypothetical protein